MLFLPNGIKKSLVWRQFAKMANNGIPETYLPAPDIYAELAWEICDSLEYREWQFRRRRFWVFLTFFSEMSG